ncbi:hypothetical protein, partial [Azospirillum sp. TSH64]|uniref:hypothetical protein n=1 Tax=Azospirillum sp. TSH64 TaxID=652740 RepID=UPI001B3B7073
PSLLLNSAGWLVQASLKRLFAVFGVPATNFGTRSLGWTRPCEHAAGMVKGYASSDHRCFLDLERRSWTVQ